MKINTVQTILFRQLRALNEQRKAETPKDCEPAGSGTNSISKVRKPGHGAMTRVRRLFCRLNRRLAEYYGLCGRTALDSSSLESRTLRLQGDEVVRLTRDTGAKSIEVREGTVWLTATPAQGDVWLRHGDRFDLGVNWPFVLQAIGRATIVLEK